MNTVIQIVAFLAVVAAAFAIPRPSTYYEDNGENREARASKGFYTAHMDVSKMEHRAEDDQSLKYYGGAKDHILIYHPVLGLTASQNVQSAVYSDGRKEGEKEEEKEEENGGNEESEVVEIQPPPKGASVAETKPVGLAIAGVGGVAASKPVATSVVGPGGLAIARPIATAIAGVPVNEAVLGPVASGGADKPQAKYGVKSSDRKAPSVAYGPNQGTGHKYGLVPVGVRSQAPNPPQYVQQTQLSKDGSNQQSIVFYPVSYHQ